MIVLNKDSIESRIHRLLETNKGYIINGMYYDKNTFSPYPFKLFSLPCSAPYDIYTDKQGYIYGNTANEFPKYYTENENSSHIVVDSNDPNISYVFVEPGKSTLFNATAHANFIYKIEEIDNKEPKLLMASTPLRIGDNNHIFTQYCSQDSTYVYFITGNGVTPSDVTFGTNIGRLNKSTLAVDYYTINSGAAQKSITTFVKDTGNYIYLFTQYHTDQVIFKRFNKITTTFDTFTIVANYDASGYLGANVPAIDHISDTKTNVYVYGGKWGSNIVKFIRYKFDFSKTTLTEILTEEDLVVTWSGSRTTMPKFANSIRDNRANLFIASDNGKKYLSLGLFEGTLSFGAAAQAATCTLSTYEISTGTSLVYKGEVVAFNGLCTKGYLSMNQNKILAAYCMSGINILTFDTVTEKYVSSQLIDIPIKSIGLDTKNQLWAIRTSGEIEMFNISIPTQISVKFESVDFTYEGTNISSNIISFAKNYSGEYVAIELELVLDGNCIFQSNGLKKLTIQTTNAGSVTTPITINGAGNVNIFPKFIRTLS